MDSLLIPKQVMTGISDARSPCHGPRQWSRRPLPPQHVAPGRFIEIGYLTSPGRPAQSQSTIFTPSLLTRMLVSRRSPCTNPASCMRCTASVTGCSRFISDVSSLNGRNDDGRRSITAANQSPASFSNPTSFGAMPSSPHLCASFPYRRQNLTSSGPYSSAVVFTTNRRRPVLGNMADAYVKHMLFLLLCESESRGWKELRYGKGRCEGSTRGLPL